MSNPPERPHTPGPEERLDSWKDIAAYLQRDVSTVQRWEKREGMPVHRHVHDKLGSVYAFRSDLDAWRARASPLAPAPMPTERRRTPWRLVVAAGGLIAVAAIVIVAVSLIGRPGTGSSPDASDLLQRARYLSVRTTDVDSRSAIELLEQAIAIDPRSARAHAELASAYVTRLAYVTPDETRELEEKAFAAAERALTLDPEVPEAYLARGDLLWTHSHRFAHERAVQEFRRALALNPQSDQAHRRLARVFVHVGFFDEARRHADLALDDQSQQRTSAEFPGTVDPVVGRRRGRTGDPVEYSGARAAGAGRGEYGFRAPSTRQTRRGPDASAIRGREIQDRSQRQPGQASRHCCSQKSDSRRAEELIAGVRQANDWESVPSRRVLRGRGAGPHRKADEAVRWLQEAAATGFPCYALFEIDPNLDPIRQDPRFQSFMAGTEKASIALRGGAVPRRQVVSWLRRFCGSVLA